MPDDEAAEPNASAFSTSALPSAATDFQRPVFCVLGLPFDAVSEQGAVDLIVDAAQRGRRCFFSTPNLNFAIGCRSDRRFRESVLRSDLSVADGMPLVWVARAFGLPLRERVAGSSIFDALRRPGRAPLSTYLFGGPDGVAERACDVLNATAGSMRCVGHRSPGFGSIADISTGEVLAAINAAGADLLIVALGAKKGQEWILQNLHRLRTPVISHLGAVVNFVAGTVVRAPPRWQRSGLEWFWRIRQEPVLWRRYADDGLAFVRILATRVVPGVVAARLGRPAAPVFARASVTIESAGDGRLIVMTGAWREGNLQPLRDAFATATSVPSAVTVQLSSVAWMDSACIGLLLLLKGHQTKTGHALTLRDPSAAAKRALHYHCAEFLLER